MPVVEKYGLMVLFGLCAVIVGVGIFAEDPLTEQALQQNQEPVAKVEAERPNDSSSSTLVDSSGVGVNSGDADRWYDEAQSGYTGSGLRTYRPEDRKTRGGPDPERGKSLPEATNGQGILEEPRQVKPRVVAKPKPRREFRDYRVRKGDTLGGIAKEQLGSTKKIDVIRRANPEIQGDKILLGKVIRIPVLVDSAKTRVVSKTPSKKSRSRKGHYIRVKKGQSLITIAKREYGDENKWKALARRNGIKNPKDLKARQRLFIPSEL